MSKYSITGPLSVSEGDSGSTAVSYTISREDNLAQAGAVDWTVTGAGGDPATAGDFGGTLPSGTVTFAPGQAMETVIVNLQGDTGVEAGEQFTITLSNAITVGIIEQASVTTTIINDDTLPPVISLSADVSATEGDVGATNFAFTVTRSVATGTASANWAVTGSGANPANGADFVGGVFPSGTISFAEGEASQVVNIIVQGDATVEPDEGFTLTLASPSNGYVIGTTDRTGTILNEDNVPPPTGTKASVLRLARDNALSGYSDAIIIDQGDSTTFGRGAGTGAAQSDGARVATTTQRVATCLVGLGYPVNTDCFMGDGNTANPQSDYPLYYPAVTLGAGWSKGILPSLGGMAFRKASASVGPMTFTPSAPWSTMRVFMIAGPGYAGTAMITVDGAAHTTVASTAATNQVIETAVTVLEGIHTIGIDSADAGEINVIGMIALAASARRLSFINGGVRGIDSIGLKASGSPWSYQSMIKLLQPVATTIAVGINDFRDGSAVAEASVLANVAAMTARARAYGDVFLRGSNEIAPASDTGTVTIRQYDIDLNAQATAAGLLFIDTIGIGGDYAAVSGAGNMSDALHPKAPFYQTLGTASAHLIDGAVVDSGYPPLLITTRAPEAVTQAGAIYSPAVRFSKGPPTWSATGLPGGWVIDSVTGAVTIPAGCAYGAYSMTLGVTDVSGRTASQTIGVRVLGSKDIVFDCFTDADGVMGAVHTAASGQTYTGVTGRRFTINANRLMPLEAGGTPSPTVLLSNAMLTSNQFAEVDLTWDTVLASQPMYIALRGTGPNTMLVAGYRSSSGGWTLGKFTAGAFAAIGSVVPFIPTAGMTKRLRAEVTGTIVSLYVDGALVATGSDGVFAAGSAGLVAGLTPSTAATGAKFDNFLAGNL